MNTNPCPTPAFGVPPSAGPDSQLQNSPPSTPQATTLQPSTGPSGERRKRREELRDEEWAMHHELMDAASVMLKTFYDNPNKTTVNDLSRVIDLASQLGRRATELDDQPETVAQPVEFLLVEFRAALKKVYTRRQAEGRPLPEGVVLDAEIVPTPAAEAAVSEPNESK